MGLPTQIKRLYTAKLNPEPIRQIVLPGIATGIGVTTTGGAALTFGAWVDVALAAAILQDTLIVGVAFDAPSATETYTVDIGSCLGFANAAAVIAAGAAAIAAAHREEVRYDYDIVGAAGYMAQPVISLTFPIWIPAGVGILARQYTVGGGDTVNVSVFCVQGF